MIEVPYSTKLIAKVQYDLAEIKCGYIYRLLAYLMHPLPGNRDVT